MKLRLRNSFIGSVGLAVALLFSSEAAVAADVSVGLTAAPTSTKLPDGQVVPMWGYTCGTPSGVTCTALNPVIAAGGTGWSPILIRANTGDNLTISLTNSLPAGVPTSLTIVGLLGGGLGTPGSTTVSPDHSQAQAKATWPALDTTTSGTPPAQGPRVQSFGTEVASGANGNLTWANLKPGTYLIESGTHPSIQGPMGLYGVLVVTTPPSGTTAGTAYPNVSYSADAPVLLSEIDPLQNNAVNTAVNTSGFAETNVWAGFSGTGNQTVQCKTVAGAAAAAGTCYPPAVNYTPLSYLSNGVAFSKTAAQNSYIAANANGATATGPIVVRYVNAGLRTHVASLSGSNITTAPTVTKSGMALIAEDGNVYPDIGRTGGLYSRIQNEVLLTAGKTTDVLIDPPGAGVALPGYSTDRSLSSNLHSDSGMTFYLGTAGSSGLPGSGLSIAGTGGTLTNTGLGATAATAVPDPYFCAAGVTMTITDPLKGVLGNDTGSINGATMGTPPASGGTVALNPNGTFTYTPASATSCGATFTYYLNGNTSPATTALVTITECDSTVQGAGCTLAGAPTVGNVTFVSNVGSRYVSAPPGVLGTNVTNAGGLDLTAVTSGTPTGGGVTLNPDGSFVATQSGTTATCPGTLPNGSTTPATAKCLTFGFQAKNIQGTTSASAATATIIFLPASGLAVNLFDSKTKAPLPADYRWIIEEDRTFFAEPRCQVNTATRPAGCPPLPVESLGYNFHTSHMPVVASGCTGPLSCESGQKAVVDPSTSTTHVAAVCDVGNGKCRAGTAKTPLLPSQVYLDPTKRYYISVLSGDAANDTDAGDPAHDMSGAQIAAGQTAVNLYLQPLPEPTAKISVFVFEDDNPLNGENDAGGGVDIIAPNEPGLGGFQITLFDQAGGLGDATGQITYDQFNNPVTNSLAHTIDPITGKDACPITKNSDALVGVIQVCPKYESDGTTLSPLAGQAVIANLYPGLYEVVATPSADRIARGEEWLQTNTLDGGKPHEAFIKPDEPGYFQEFGPGGFHVSIGFANPAIINARKTGFCSSPLNTGTCNNTLNVQVTNTHMSRTPDQRTYSSESYDHYAFTNCYIAVGPADAEDFAFQKCTPDGKVSFTNMPPGVFKLTVFDQWNDIMLDGLVGTVEVAGGTAASGASTTKEFPVTQWRTNLSTRTFIDTNGDGVSQDSEPGLSLVNTNIRYRDGSIGFFNNTDLSGNAGFNEVFPFMNWLVVETSQTRFKPTWTHTVYDGGGPVDCSSAASGLCSTIAAHIANTSARVPLPAELRIPGAKYCSSADCPSNDPGAGTSTGTLFPPQAFGNTMGWQGLLGQNSFMEFAVKPFKEATATTPAENGGISGQVIYASTRPFDDPSLLLQLQWEPGVPHVTVNLYSKTVDSNGNEKLNLVDTTQSAGWDDWAQGFRKDPNTGDLITAGSGANSGYVPNISCPGQDGNSPFFATLKNSKQWLDQKDPATLGSVHSLAYHSQFKCYDGWSQLNQIQPAPYDGYYAFPSVTAIDPATGKPATGKTNCHMATTAEPWGCVPNPDTSDTFRSGAPMLKSGTYVVEVIVPPGYELVKEEDKNILLGDVFVAPVTNQFAGYGNIFIMPDQASIASAYNPNNPAGLNTTTNLGATPRNEGDTGSVERFWPCVGAERIVPDYNSLFPGAQQAAPFAGATRRLCDRKEVTLEDQASALTKFYVFSPTHIAGHFTGTITNDFAAEFDPFSPQFGEKFGPPTVPVVLKNPSGDPEGTYYSDQWGIYNGLHYSSWTVNPPNPTGYAPQMAIACMNDPGNGANPDPAYSPAYSNFCYEQPFMPGFTTYMDTPVVSTMAFADQYNLPDTEYPDGTPAVDSVIGDAAGPWVSASGNRLTITCLGSHNADPCSKVVPNPNFSGPNAPAAPFNQKTITRHYGFGGNGGTVTIAGTPATVNSWTNDTIVLTVPPISATLTNGVGSTCSSSTSTTAYPATGQTPSQRTATSTQNSAYRCGELVITRGDNGKQSIDAVTVTVAGKPPTVVSPSSAVTGTFGEFFPTPLQDAIDAAAPGDLLLVQPGVYHENVIMWKPVRLQGVGAGSVTINADSHPAGKMDSWRRRVACLFGLTTSGATNPGNGSFGGDYACPNSMHMRADRIPFEAFVGWDAAGNGNLAQILQEPTLMGAYEGAGISVLGRGIRIPSGSSDLWGQGTPGVPGAFPDGSRYLSNRNVTTGPSDIRGNDCTSSTNESDGRDYGTANYLCNPSRIDGISIINSSQGGGAIFLHGWNHFLEIANVRASANHGTLTGGVNLGNGETPPVFVNDGTICGPGVTNTPAPLCPPTGALSPIAATTPGTNGAYPFQLNVRTRLHHSMIAGNASIGDALFSGTPSGAGAVTVSAGTDQYEVDHNWIAGNLSTGDGGGMQHLGLSFNGKIDHNFILFNQSTNPTLPTNGGGLTVQGANSDRTLPNGQECGTTSDIDCPPGIGDGTGPGLVIDANLVVGNSAESGSGGGIRLQQVNGTEVASFALCPSGGGLCGTRSWYDVTLTNNVIANNVAGWDGGGVSMQDALKVTFVNNTVVSNDTTASAGVLFKTLGAINSSAPPPGCIPTPDPTNPQNPLCEGRDAPHGPQPAGMVTMSHTPNLIDSLPATLICPPGFNYGNSADSLASRTNGLCKSISIPSLVNDMFWQNRAFSVGIVGSGSGNQSQQNLVALTPLLTQTATGQCPGGANYWDVGARGDTNPTDHSGGAQLTATNSLLTSTSGVLGNNNFSAGVSPVIAQYCNGARIPPEGCGGTTAAQNPECLGFNAPPGASETTGLTQLFVFGGIQPTATVDEGHNWLNLSYGPLTLNRSAVQASSNPPELMLASASTGLLGGAYSINDGSAAVNRGTNTGIPSQTANDFFGNPRARTTANPTDVGAVEAQAITGTFVVANPAPLNFSNVVAGSGTTTRDLVLSNNGTIAFLVPTPTFTTGFSRVSTGSFTNLPPNCSTTTALAAGASCTIRVQWTVPATVTSVTGSVTIAGVSNSPVTINANTVAATFTATVSPNPLVFGNWATGTTSAPLMFTVNNTGNSGLSGLSFGFGAATANFARVTTGVTFPASAPNCGTTLAVGSTCSVAVTFAPSATGTVSRNLTVTATGATINSPLVLSGTGVATRATVEVQPNPSTITLASLAVNGPLGQNVLTQTGAVSLVNTAPAGGSWITVSNVSVTTTGASGPGIFSSGPLAGPANCVGAAIPPGGSCTVTVRYTDLIPLASQRRTTATTGTISFTNTGTPTPATGTLQGIPTP